MIDDCPPGYLAVMRSAECTLVRACLADRDGYEIVDAALAAISALPEHSTPCHLAHGPLDHAGYLVRLGGIEVAETAIAKACDIAGCLRCQLLPDRAADLTPAELRIGARW